MDQGRSPRADSTWDQNISENDSSLCHGGEHVRSRIREAAPIRAELKRHDDARDDSLIREHDALISAFNPGWTAGTPRPEMYDEQVRSFGKPDVSPAGTFNVVRHPVELTINVAFKWQLNSFV
jgi:hypothetical protein